MGMNTCAQVEIRESQQQPSTLRVDREKNCIRDVKLLGFESRNVGKSIGLDRAEFGEAINKPYRYAKGFAETAAPLYEGKAVNVDHWGREGDRPLGSVFGEVHGVYTTPDGIYARELRYSPAHPQAEHILDLAEKFPTKLGLSHIAQGTPVLVEGLAEISEWEPECVDLVSGPATTSGLYESTSSPRKGRRKMAKKLKVREVIESAKRDTLSRILKEMESSEDFPEVADMAMPEAVEANPDDQLKAAIMSLLTAKLEKASTDELEKLLDVLGVENSLTAVLGGSSAGKKPEASKEGESESGDDDAVKEMESLRSENRKLKATAALNEAGRQATAVRVMAVYAAPDDQQASLIESWPKDLLPQGNGGKRPLHSPPSQGDADDLQAFEKLLTKYAGAK